MTCQANNAGQKGKSKEVKIPVRFSEANHLFGIVSQKRMAHIHNQVFIFGDSMVMWIYWFKIGIFNVVDVQRSCHQDN
jgi:hypothetical protein